jgi:hypothetical protein
MEELGRQAGEMVKLNTDKWNHTNIINAKCILASMYHHKLLKHSTLQQEKSNGVESNTSVNDPMEAFQAESE